ncbi:MAG: hypothetical protein A3H07_01250 [Candidatus Jacksonbacteria bacterium RIFCSPLOWO2_12_FULL_44_15b]|nr:MAG: hypothetical protein A3H07_01250 [Candidatus Jacksonbacteria bacterium RIFCSPLOWO2_12_FULL_44_15b]
MIAYFAKLIFKKYRPRIILVQEGGSDLARSCFFVLKQKFRVRLVHSAIECAFLLNEEPRSFSDRARALFDGVRLLLFSYRDYPEIMIIDGVSDEREMPFRSENVYACVTVRGFNKRAERVFGTAFSIVNGDDTGYKDDYSLRNKVHVISYGITKKSVRVKGEEPRMFRKDGVSGLYMKLLCEGTATPLFIPNCSMNHAKIALAGAALGIVFSLTPLEIARGLEEFGSCFA